MFGLGVVIMVRSRDSGGSRNYGWESVIMFGRRDKNSTSQFPDSEQIETLITLFI